MNIVCEKCEGEGVVELTGIYADTLEQLKEYEEIIATDLAREMSCSAQTMWNRLAWLESHGLARSRYYGRKTFFSAIQ